MVKNEESGKVSPPAYATLRDMLRDNIISGKLAPGTRLTIAEVAQMYGVSQMPVREALQVLHGEGLLELLPHRGATVRKIDEKLVSDLYDLRGAVESLLALKSIKSFRAEELIEAEKINLMMTEVATAGDIPAFVHLNNEFHQKFYSKCDNAEALKLYERHADLIGTLRRKYGYSKERLEQIVQQHQAILLAYKMNEPVLLEYLVKAHCKGAKQDLIFHMRLERQRTQVKDRIQAKDRRD